MNEKINEVNVASNNEVNEVVSPRKKRKKIVIIIIAIIIAGAVAYYFDPGNVFTGKKIVAVVNGDKITNSEVGERFEQIIALAQDQGIKTDNPASSVIAKERVLDELIATKLLLQGAEEAGVVIDKEVIDSEIQFIIDQIGDEKIFKDQLNEAGITKEQFRNDIVERLTIREFISQNINLESINVTEKEITDFYGQISEAQENVPPLEAISSQIASQLLSNKQQEAIVAFVATLRDVADIEISL